MGCILLIVRAQRQIFKTLTAGDPFQPTNVDRLRLIGLILAVLELGGYVIWDVAERLPREIFRDVQPDFRLTAWFAVLAVFVLAEVFREGARSRWEVELRI